MTFVGDQGEPYCHHGIRMWGMERDELHQAQFCPCYIMDNRPNETLIPDRLHPGLTIAALTARHWGVGGKYATAGIKVKILQGVRTFL